MAKHWKIIYPSGHTAKGGRNTGHTVYLKIIYSLRLFCLSWPMPMRSWIGNRSQPRVLRRLGPRLDSPIWGVRFQLSTFGIAENRNSENPINTSLHFKTVTIWGSSFWTTTFCLFHPWSKRHKRISAWTLISESNDVFNEQNKLKTVGGRLSVSGHSWTTLTACFETKHSD